MKNNKVELLKNLLIEKNVTFLFGAGASSPFFSSLGNFERILSHNKITEEGANLTKILFYKLSIADNSYLLRYLNNLDDNSKKTNEMMRVLNEYTRFIHNILEFLKVRNSRVSPKRINIVTTNYDLFIEAAIDNCIQNNSRIFFNDGTNGYAKRILSTDNFNKTLLYSGVFDNYSNEMPVINMIKCHGSINWKKYCPTKEKKQVIQVTPTTSEIDEINSVLLTFNDKLESDIESYSKSSNLEFSDINSFIKLFNLKDTDLDKLVHDMNGLSQYSKDDIKELRDKINNLQIVLPTKRKFQTTLIEEHYFNMLRLLSYELEKEQSALIVFGFSFYDEHITDIVQRSLNNPNLIVVIFCYSNSSESEIVSRFNFSTRSVPKNIIFIKPNDFLQQTINIADFKKETEDGSFSQCLTIKDNETVKIYDSKVNLLEKETGNKPILSFDSLNKCLEEEIQNRYKPIDTKEVGGANGK